jgi:dihydrodipicolinate synthase/N-acetylneuraminate lyase
MRVYSGITRSAGREAQNVMTGVANGSKDVSACLAEEFAEVGADRVIAVPPWGAKLGSTALVEECCQAVAQAGRLGVGCCTGGGRTIRWRRPAT